MRVFVTGVTRYVGRGVGVHAVIHTAFSLFPVADQRINVDGSLRLLRVAARGRVRKFVFTSSSLVYGLAECVFGAVGAPPPLNVDIARLATFRAGPRSIARAQQLLGFEPRAAEPLAAILNHYQPTVAA